MPVRWAVAVLPILILIAAIPMMPGGWGAGSLERRLAEYRERGLLDHAYDELVWHSAQPYVWDTALERTMTVNSARVPGGVNIYVFRDDPEGYFDDFACGCRAVDPGDTIVCDGELLDYLRDFLTEAPSGPFHAEFLRIWTEARRRLGEPAGPEDQRSGLEAYDGVAVAYTQALLRWVIGHEIGHVRLDHLDRDEISVRDREIGADDFVVDTLARVGSTRDLLFMSLMLESMINTLYADSHRQLHPDDPAIVGFPLMALLQPAVTLADVGDHPPLLVRSLSMWKRLGDEPGFGHIADIAATIDSKITTGPSGAELTLCRSAPTTYLAHQLVIVPDRASGAEMVDTHIETGLLWADMTRYDEAERHFDRAVAEAEILVGDERNRALPEALRWRGIARYIQRHHREAAADFDYAISLDGSDPALLSATGWNRLALGDLRGAETNWRAALTADPDHADALAGLAIAEAEAGHRDRSVAYYRAAIELDAGYGSDAWLEFSRFWPEDAIRRLGAVRRNA
ncbi:tetratricopeptide repeat protein [Nocardia takedensis]